MYFDIFRIINAVFDIWLSVGGYITYAVLLLLLVKIMKDSHICLQDIKNGGFSVEARTEVTFRESVFFSGIMFALMLVSVFVMCFLTEKGEVLQIYTQGLRALNEKNVTWYRSRVFRMISWVIALAQLTLAGCVMSFWNIRRKERIILRSSYIRMIGWIMAVNVVLGLLSAVANRGIHKGYIQFVFHLIVVQLYIAFLLFYKEKLKGSGVIYSVMLGAFWKLSTVALTEWACTSNRRNPYLHPFSGAIATIGYVLFVVFLILLIKKILSTKKSFLTWYVFSAFMASIIADLTIGSVFVKMCSMHLSAVFGLE